MLYWDVCGYTIKGYVQLLIRHNRLYRCIGLHVYLPELCIILGAFVLYQMKGIYGATEEKVRSTRRMYTFEMYDSLSV